MEIDETRIIKDQGEYRQPENHVFRKAYRKLEPAEASLIDAMKDKAFELYQLIEKAPAGRNASLAKTHLEDAVMRAVKAVTE